MEALSFEERNLVERRTFHRIQQRIHWSRVAILTLIAVGLVGVTMRLTHSYQRYADGWFFRHVNHDHEDEMMEPGPESQARILTREMQDEAYVTAVACMFFIVNAFGIVAVLLESFLLVTAYVVFNIGVFMLSFTADNSLPHGLIFKLILLFLILLTVLFFTLMRSRRLS